jgi:flavin-dependent dehydrogenase
MANIPNHIPVLVIGGGPGGSYAAAALAREGVPVVVLEADKFPRYHIGESQLASIRHFLRFIDCEKAFDAVGFTPKVGAGFKLNRHKREGYTDFVSVDPKNVSWNTIRSQADQIMLRHAEKEGAQVYEETKVTEIEFEGGNPNNRAIAAHWQNKAGHTGTISFDYVIDASGRNGIICTKYLKNRTYNEDLKNVAVWGYWKNGGDYLAGTSRGGSPLSEALTDETGWTWYIPLHDGSTSVGVVMHVDKSNAKKQASKEAGEDTSLSAHYHRQLKYTPIIEGLLKGATMVKKPDIGMVNSASDYSYQSAIYAGPGWRVVGDAGAFIDPFFSSGVHLASAGGLTAAASICAVRKGEVTEEAAAAWHTARAETSYTRFLLVVLSAYQQMRSQSEDILSTDSEDNFDRAFDFFKPIIQGTHDTGKTADNLAETIKFLAAHAFEGSTPEERHALEAKYQAATEAGEEASDEDKAILKQIAVHKLMRTEDVENLDNFVTDQHNGIKLRLVRGNLGLDVSS